jgi:hypothetical protein
MERRLKVLFLYFGQPRFIEESILHHDNIVLSLRNFFDIEMEYHLWNKYNEYHRTRIDEDDRVSGNYELKDVNEKTYKQIVENRIVKTKCNFYDYKIAEDVWEKCKDFIDKKLFMAKFAQTISKAIAVESIDDRYDIVFLLRTDLCFDRKSEYRINSVGKSYVTMFENAFHEFLDEQKTWNSKRVLGFGFESNENKRLILTNYSIHSSLLGSRVDDKAWFSNASNLKIYFKNWQEKIQTFIEYHYHNYYPLDVLEQHYISANFSNIYNSRKKIKEGIWFLALENKIQTKLFRSM